MGERSFLAFASMLVFYEVPPPERLTIGDMANNIANIVLFDMPFHVFSKRVEPHSCSINCV